MIFDILKKVIEQAVGDVSKIVNEFDINPDAENANTASGAGTKTNTTAARNGSKTNAQTGAGSNVKTDIKTDYTDTTPISDAKLDEIRKGLQVFKVGMLRGMPFYGQFLLRLKVIEDYNVKTACTNGKCIRYNPAFMAEFNEGERNYILMHEMLHVIFLHWKRVGGRDPLIWNIAADWIVNDAIDKMKWNVRGKVKLERPEKGCFIDELSNGDYTEKLYESLINRFKERSSDGNVIWKGNELVQRVSDLEAPDTLSEMEGELCAGELRKLLKDSVKKYGLEGSSYIPRELLEAVASKKLPWHKLLYDFLQLREDEESSYYTPERKYIHMELIVPGLNRIEDELGEIWAFVDTSGSISGDELSQFMTQLYRISAEFNCVFNIAFWDTSVTDVYKNIRCKDKIMDCMANHSGGTDVNCVYDYIEKNNIKPEVMIILTDGYFGALKKPAGRLREKTILVVTENGAAFDDKNDIGRLARL
ncbi:MAG: VWA-like domain-containing protein [Eubacterium sp.]|nr:VWA-like domain-containing protein [Eubacterium sp.]